MNVKIISTGSKGNCAVIDDALVIDAGWNVTVEGVAVFLTHQHTDHVKHLDKMLGMPIYALPETIEKLQTDMRFAYTSFTPMERLVDVEIHVGPATYYVVPIPVKHDAPCVAFDILKVCSETGEQSRIFFGTDFNALQYEDVFIAKLKSKVYDAIYIEANNTLNETDFMDVYFPEEGTKEPRDAFHRLRSFRNHANVDYIRSLFSAAGYSEFNKFTEPVTLLHKSSHYYPQNPARVVELCKMVKIVNPIH